MGEEDADYFREYFKGKSISELLELLEMLDDDKEHVQLPGGEQWLRKYSKRGISLVTKQDFNNFYQCAEEAISSVVKNKEKRLELYTRLKEMDISQELSNLEKKINLKKGELIEPLKDSLNRVWESIGHQNKINKIKIDPENSYLQTYLILIGKEKSLSMYWGRSNYDSIVFRKERDPAEDKIFKFKKRKIIHAEEGDFLADMRFDHYLGIKELLNYLMKAEEIPLIKTLIHLPKIINKDLLAKECLLDNILAED